MRSRKLPHSPDVIAQFAPSTISIDKSTLTQPRISMSMALHEQYILRVSAGATYDQSKHEDVLVNSEIPMDISSDLVDAKLYMRVKDYRGYPKGSPSTSPYFSTPQHPYDRYSISFSFTPKNDINGDDLVFGNDFDHPIRDRLPPLFDKAFAIVKWWIDPGLDGDVYGDEPYLYGPLLSSINVLRICGTHSEDIPNPDQEHQVEDSAAATQAEAPGKETATDVYEEGGEGSGLSVREEQFVPGHSPARQKFFLTESNRRNFTFEGGREYKCDFYNPYLDFNEFALKIGYGLPTISIIKHWDGQPLRYVLKNRKTKQELFVIMIQLLPIEEIKQDEAGKDEEHEDTVSNDLD